MPKTKTSKTQFVLSLPTDMPAADVVKKARAEGMVLSPLYVHGIRSSAKRKARRAENTKPSNGRKRGRPAAQPKAQRAAAPRVSRGHDNGATEEILLAAAAEIGLGRALALLESRRQQLLDALGS